MDKLLLVSADGHAIMPPEVWPEYLDRLLAHLDVRCGYCKPAEGEERLVDVEPLLQGDLARIGAA